MHQPISPYIKSNGTWSLAQYWEDGIGIFGVRGKVGAKIFKSKQQDSKLTTASSLHYRRHGVSSCASQGSSLT